MAGGESEDGDSGSGTNGGTSDPEESGEGDGDYGLADVVDLEETEAPDLPYRPSDPEAYDPGIALIGTGGIAEQHLTAYTEAGYEVVALCNRTAETAEAYRAEFDLDCAVYADHEAVLAREDVDVVDVLTHPEGRVPILEDAIEAGKHVLSQKPFVLDLSDGERLIDRAEERGVKLAVNQNGRWAPHWAYARAAVAEGLIGEIHGVHCNVHWDHNWIGETDLDGVEHVVLYDFGVHWFDILTCLIDADPERVAATCEPSPDQEATPPLLGSATVEYESAQATLVFDGDTKLGPEDRTVVAGGAGTVKCEGPDLEDQELTLYTEAGYASPDLETAWFPDGFHGAMAELLSAIEADREPENSARDNLDTLKLTYAAVASAEDGQPKEPGSVRRMRGTGRN
jgi:predicted dehydrogenase